MLWGRVAVLAGAIVFAFLLGGWLLGGDGAEEAEVQRLREQRDEWRERAEQLNEQLDALSAEREAERAESAEDDEDDGDEDVDDDADDSSDEEEGEIYVVRQGDTLSSIANEFYGDPSKAGWIAEVNDLSTDDHLVVGMELRIPPAENDG